MSTDAGLLLRVVRGAPTDEQLAAVVVALAAYASRRPAVARAPSSGWADRTRLVRGSVRPGHGAWRMSRWHR